MRSESSNGNYSRLARLAALALLCAAIPFAGQQPSAKATAPTSIGAANYGAPEGFDTAQEAADALVKAAESFDTAALVRIFGQTGADLVLTDEIAYDRKRAADFAEKAREKKAVSIERKNSNRAFLLVGDEDWPFPVPIVKKAGKWSFDADAGRQELLYRRIGANELDAIQICHGYVEAQQEYALEKREGYQVNQYAQRIISTPGKQDGLTWKNPDGTWGGPIGEKIAEVIAQGYSGDQDPYHGYYFKVLKGQGPSAPLGQLDYVIEGVMIGGFALVAAPAAYRVTGVKTFMVSQDGVVYQKDLGPATLDEFKKMERFNPDKSWTPVEDAEQGDKVASVH
jgi:hypothetical protein